MKLPVIPGAGLALLMLAPPALQAEQVVFNEIHYNPKDGKPEYIEIHNLTATVFDIANWKVTDGVDYEFPAFDAADPEASFLQPFEYILLSPVDEATLRAAYTTIPATAKIYGPWTGALSNGGERLALEDKNGVLKAEISYDDDGRRWPIAADGAGHSLRLSRANHGASKWRNWSASTIPDGTPGRKESRATPLSDLLALSEVHFAADGSVDWVEIHARKDLAISVDGYSIASLRDFSDAVPVSGVVPAGGYASFDVAFPTEADGGVEIYLFNSIGRIAAAQKFTRDAGQESFQSLPVGEEWFGGAGHTRDAPNAPPTRNTDIVINEIMYDPPSDARTGEFVELYNRGPAAVDLGGWSFVDGIGFTFPTGTILESGAYLVVAADADWITAQYGAIPVLGNFSGSLRDSGELLRLEDVAGHLADQVDYLPSGDWPELADGDGSSMELKHPEMDNDSPSAWADSDESNKTSMQAFSYTADFEQVTWLPLTTGQELHLHLVGDSHVVIEDISFAPTGGGANLIANPANMSPTNSSALGWVCQGTHWASFIQGRSSLNLVSDGHGDNKANRAEVDLGNLTYNQSYTLSFNARWVSGKPRLIAQTLDHGFGTSFRLPIPNDLGTPGAANSRLAASPAPTVSGVLHSPAVPSTTDPVKVTAQVDSAAALASVELVHRIDTVAGDGSWIRTAMHDDGASGGDERAGDGLYTATVSDYQTQGNIVQFFVEAAAAGGGTTMLPKLGPDRPAMWITDDRDMPDSLLRERFIISQYDRAALVSSTGDSAAYDYNFPRMSNHFFNATFIANELEVFYNAEIRKSGSPFTREPGNTLVHGKWKLPGDRLFRERRRSVFDPSGAPGGSTPRFYDDRIARYFLYLLGHPTNEMEFVHWVVNGDNFQLRENHEPISNDFLDRNWDGGSEGTLLRIDDEWRFTSDDGESRQARNADWSYKNSNNPVRYHSEWLMRSREAEYDYGNFIEFVRTLDEDKFNESVMNRMADRDLLCLNAAVRGYDADWDTLTLNRGKNAYFYRPKGGRWMLAHWDGDRVFGNSGSAILGSLPGIPTYFGKPYVRRVMNYYLTELLNKHTKGSARTETWMDLEVAATAGTGITMTKSHYVNWFNAREGTARTFIGEPLTESFAITTSNAPTTEDEIWLKGTSPSDVYGIRVAGQPWVESSWSVRNGTLWTLIGVRLKTGVNNITVEGVNHEGVVVHSETFAITKTGNTMPAMALEGSPASFNVGLSEGLDLDASASYDPDGGALDFAWEVTPATGVSLLPAGALASAEFTRPGLYQFTVTGTDPDGGGTAITREAAVYGGEGFSSFSNPRLEPFWQESQVEVINNTLAGPWYSLGSRPGHLVISVPGDIAYPLGTVQAGNSGHPWIKRALPATGDWVLQTDLELYGLQFGDFMTGLNFMTGLMVEVQSGADLNRYAFGHRDGEFLEVQTLSEAADPVSLSSDPYALSSEMVVRIRREGDDLVFEWRDDGMFSEAHRLTMPAGSTVTAGGPFAATGSPEILNVSFDYVMMIDTAPVAPATDALVISEVMYKPLGGESLEFLELYNTGATPINLAGFRFPQGQPFDEFVFGDVTIAPGGYLLVVHNLAAFRARYGNGLDPLIAGEWVNGNLSNSNDTINLLDPAGITVLSFEYFDVPPWPTSPDTDGTSLVLIDPLNGDPTQGTSWTASAQVGGSPGGPESQTQFDAWMAARGETDPYAIKPPEPVNNMLSYAFGLDLAGGDATVALPRVGRITVGDETYLSFEYRRRLSDPTLGYAVEISRDALNWSDASPDLVEIGITDEGDGTERVTLRLKDPLGSEKVVLLRVSVTLDSDSGAAFDAWMAARGETDPYATKPGEPVDNLLSYAFGLDLAGGDASVALPRAGRITVGENTFLSLEYRRRLSDPALGYAVQISRNALIWSDASPDLVEVGVADEGDGTERVTVRLKDPLGSEQVVLLRVSVTPP